MVNKIRNIVEKIYSPSERVYNWINRIGTTFVLGSLLACSTLSNPEGREDIEKGINYNLTQELVRDANMESISDSSRVSAYLILNR